LVRKVTIVDATVIESSRRPGKVMEISLKTAKRKRRMRLVQPQLTLMIPMRPGLKKEKYVAKRANAMVLPFGCCDTWMWKKSIKTG
jgi:hypothetical protein